MNKKEYYIVFLLSFSSILSSLERTNNNKTTKKFEKITSPQLNTNIYQTKKENNQSSPFSKKTYLDYLKNQFPSLIRISFDNEKPTNKNHDFSYKKIFRAKSQIGKNQQKSDNKILNTQETEKEMSPKHEITFLKYLQQIAKNRQKMRKIKKIELTVNPLLRSEKNDTPLCFEEEQKRAKAEQQRIININKLYNMNNFVQQENRLLNISEIPTIEKPSEPNSFECELLKIAKRQKTENPLTQDFTYVEK